jgi:hypothetical protein
MAAREHIGTFFALQYKMEGTIVFSWESRLDKGSIIKKNLTLMLYY